MSRLKVVLVDEDTGYAEDVVSLSGFPRMEGEEGCTQDAWFGVLADLENALRESLANFEVLQ